MLKAVSIILDINKKNKILTQREKNKLLNYAKSITAGSDIHIIDSIDENKQKSISLKDCIV